MIIVIMGVTGCGKTTVGGLLAAKLNLPFLDADQYHPEENKHKMTRGIPLTDVDRIPWLNQISNVLADFQEKNGAVLACSALKNQYREILQSGLKSNIIWIHLAGTSELILERLRQRHGHFMSPDLLGSQFETLETPENACNISIENSPEEIVNEIIKEIANEI